MTGEAPHEREEEQSEPSRRRPPYMPGARYSAFVGIAFIAIIVIAAINAASTDEGTLLGSEDVGGRPFAEFAVPDVRGPLDGDANIAQDDCETAANPCPLADRRMPACEIDAEDAIRVCDLFDRPLVLTFWFTSPSACVDTQDAITALAPEYEDRVNFASIAVRGEREDVKRIVAERDWPVPVGWDRDGAVSNVYSVGLCPTVAIARPGGIFEAALVGNAAAPDAVAEVLDGLLEPSGRSGGASG